jgi:hypothetical protein
LAIAGKFEADKFADHSQENLLHSQFSIADKFAGFNEQFDITEEILSSH